MAIDGDPYLTKKLDERRSGQRAVLAGISERTLASAGIVGKAAVPTEPTGRVETALRRLAQSLIDEAQGETLQRPAQLLERRALRAWLGEFDVNDWPSRVIDMMETESVVPPVEDEAVVQLVRDQYDVLARIATLLVWADDLAGDYTDPRIKRGRERTS